MRISINGLDRYSETGVVKKIHWSANKVHEGHGYSMDMVTPLPNKDPSDIGFIPYQQITLDVVLEWLNQSGDVQKAADLMSKKIEEPTIEIGLPDGWDIQSMNLADED